MKNLKPSFLKLSLLKLSGRQISQISAYCEKIYPEEACGLLIGAAGEGKDHLGGRTVCEVIFTKNISDQPTIRFDIDPAVLLAVMKDGRMKGQKIIGHFHSHPDQNAEASENDRAMISDGNLIWLIVSVMRGRAERMNIYSVHKSLDGFTLKQTLELL